MSGARSAESKDPPPSADGRGSLALFGMTEGLRDYAAVRKNEGDPSGEALGMTALPSVQSYEFASRTFIVRRRGRLFLRRRDGSAPKKLQNSYKNPLKVTK